VVAELFDNSEYQNQICSMEEFLSKDGSEKTITGKNGN
jgi:hypothetical protein